MLPSLLPFEKLPVTIVVLGCYLAAIISTVIIQERLPAAPQPRGVSGLNLHDAWRDLQALAQIAHPFNSHQNDEAGHYIARKLEHMQHGKEFMTVDVDTLTNASWYPSAHTVTYMESRNIVVKFDGSKWNDSAVLFTAHYDTSSLAPGATDDSISVVSLLQIAEYLASSQPERSIILLFDDGEEDGLDGAHVFLRHPWAKLVQSFVNVEGAGAGGRPNLFRSSSAQLTWAFKSAAHPHGSILFSDAFNLGLVRSRTDYDVYTRAGIPGVDYAFYTGRQKYHTMDDSISSLHDRRSLWAMMENLHGVVSKLAHEPNSNDSEDRHFVFFDLFGEDLFYMRSDFFIIFNILLLLLAPLAIGLLIYSLYQPRKLYLTWKGSLRFVFSLFFGLVIGGVCAAWYTKYNPLIVYKSPYLVLISISCLTAFCALIPLNLAHLWSPAPVQRVQVMLEMCTFWWIVAIVNLVFMARNTIFGGYFITFFFAATAAATIIALLDQHRLDPKPDITVATFTEEEPHNGNDGLNGTAVDIESATERTPLLAAEDVLSPPKKSEDRLGWIWILEFVLIAIFPVVIMLQIMFTLLAALGPTVVDGSNPLFVYTIISLTVLLAILPIAPFAHKLPLTFYFFILIVGIATTLYTTLDFPFTSNCAFKSLFWQSVDLQTENSTVTLTGLGTQLEQVLKEVPSVDYDQISWDKSIRPGVYSAQFPGLAPRPVPDTKMIDWVTISVNKTSISSALIRVSGVDTRACRLEFEHGYNVSQVVVRGSNTEGYRLPSSSPIKYVNLWRRTWNGTWEVDVELTAAEGSGLATSNSVLDGKVSCLWSDRSNGKIPAVDELYVSFPTWATLSAWGGGLVEGWKTFSI